MKSLQLFLFAVYPRNRLKSVEISIQQFLWLTTRADTLGASLRSGASLQSCLDLVQHAPKLSKLFSAAVCPLVLSRL